MFLLKAIIGNPDKVGAARYWKLSEEKARRLYVYTDHFSSWQSRDPDDEKYGGAITAPLSAESVVGKNLILSFSGLPEHGDEAICIVLAIIFRWITDEEAEEIIAISNNPLAKPLRKICKHLS